MFAKRAREVPQPEPDPRRERAIERLLLLRLAKQCARTVDELLYGPQPLTDREFAEWKALWVFESQLAWWQDWQDKQGEGG